MFGIIETSYHVGTNVVGGLSQTIIIDNSLKQEKVFVPFSVYKHIHTYRFCLWWFNLQFQFKPVKMEKCPSSTFGQNPTIFNFYNLLDIANLYISLFN